MGTDIISLGDQWRIFREEGLPSLQNRSKERAEEQRRFRKLNTLKEKNGRLELAADSPLVLNVGYLPPAHDRLATHTQLMDRLDAEKQLRTVALVYPRNDGWSLEIWTRSMSGRFDLGESTNPVEVIVKAARLVRARMVHIENMRGLPLHLVQGLEDRDYPVILSIHDFTVFCARPQLVEQPSGRFCGFSTDMNRCRACLQDLDMGVQRTQTDYRKVGAEAVKKARILVFPSAFMQRQFQKLYPMRSAGQQEIVLAPATRPSEVEPWTADRKHVAFVGGAYHHSGGHGIVPTMDLIRRRDKKARGFVYGVGDGEVIKKIKKGKGLVFQGYYRAGTLGTMLAKDKIAVAVFPSIWPDPYGLVVDECLASGVPVVAFDFGAVADRLRFWEVGEVVKPKHGAAGLATAVFDSFGSGNKVPKDIIKTVPSIQRVARRHWDMYKGLRIRMR